ncbi:Uncharacterised protein [Vibrio cholerae]|nr:Uncharacterised protein [Vibrio cholerae]
MAGLASPLSSTVRSEMIGVRNISVFSSITELLRNGIGLSLGYISFSKLGWKFEVTNSS